MDAKVIREHQRREPFRPFRIHVSGGSSYDIIRGRETLLISRRELVIFLDHDEHGIPQRTVRVTPKSISHLEAIDGSSAQGSKAVTGEGRR